MGQLLSSLLQGAQRTKISADVVELKPGQVVRGTVLRLINNQEALLSIQGVKVTAKLETPLQQGASTWLTVLPDMGDGQIRLKPVEGVPLRGGGLAELMKALGLPDTSNNRQLIQLLSQAGLPLTKHTMAALIALSAERPADVAAEQWNQAAIYALKRGLPADAAQVGALRQAVFGQPLHQMMLDLQSSLGQLLTRAGDLSASTQKALGQAQAAIENVIRQSGASAPIASSAVPSSGSDLHAQAAANQQGKPQLQAVLVEPSSTTSVKESLSSQAVRSPSMEAAAALSGRSGQPVSAESLPGLERGSREAVLNHNANPASPSQVGTKLAASTGVVPATTLVEGAASLSIQDAPRGSEQQALSATTAGSTPSTAPPAGSGSAAAGGNWMVQLLKSMGLDHEASLMKAASQSESPMGTAVGGKPAAGQEEGGRMASTVLRDSPSAGTPSQPVVPGAVAAERAEVPNLKAALLSLMSSGDLPEPIKESVQQTIQQLTGQQLLLSGDRSSPLTYLTLSIPLFASDHQQTASVHVQSRQTAQGSIDADNCRLWFDLNLAHLGHTLLDVQVLNRMVSVTVHSDFKQIDKLVDLSREELNKSLHDMGYSMLSMKVQPLPERAAADASHDLQSKSTYYDTKPYKGVDLRV